MSHKIVVIGAGYAGVLAAKKLDRRLKKEDVDITIIDRNSYHTMLTELHEVAANRVPEDHVRISIKKIFAGRRVHVALDDIQTVDYDNKTVVGTVTNYPYDHLVVACGSKPTFFGTPGAQENAYYLWSYDDAVWLKHHIVEVFKDAASEKDPALRKQLLTFYVVGAGFTGAEMVGEPLFAPNMKSSAAMCGSSMWTCWTGWSPRSRNACRSKWSGVSARWAWKSS